VLLKKARNLLTSSRVLIERAKARQKARTKEAPEEEE
jgi:hypothetical protein